MISEFLTVSTSQRQAFTVNCKNIRRSNFNQRLITVCTKATISKCLSKIFVRSDPWIVVFLVHTGNERK